VIRWTGKPAEFVLLEHFPDFLPTTVPEVAVPLAKSRGGGNASQELERAGEERVRGRQGGVVLSVAPLHDHGLGGKRRDTVDQRHQAGESEEQSDRLHRDDDPDGRSER
jgi:hypothetical protein